MAEIVEQPADHPEIRLPEHWYAYIEAPGIDANGLGIYEWRIAEAGSYIGKFKRIRRPTREYGRNVARLLNNRPYRRAKPDGFRRIHRELERAHRDGRKIELLILENVDSTRINRRERELIAQRGNLNDPPFGGSRE